MGIALGCSAGLLLESPTMVVSPLIAHQEDQGIEKNRPEEQQVDHRVRLAGVAG